MIVIVVGMHRSGASIVAALLHRNGVSMGEEEILSPTPAAADFEDAFENPRIRILNDRMAERQGYVIESWGTSIPQCRPGAITRLRMRRLIRHYDERSFIWGFKDPRTCLTLEPWLREIERVSTLEDTKVIHIVRDPDEVARSMATHSGISTDTALRLWNVYNERAMAAIDSWKIPTHYLSYENLRSQPEAASASLLQFVGILDRENPSEKPAASLLRRGERAPRDDADGAALSEAVMQTNARILRRVHESRRGADRGAE